MEKHNKTLRQIGSPVLYMCMGGRELPTKPGEQMRLSSQNSGHFKPKLGPATRPGGGEGHKRGVPRVGGVGSAGVAAALGVFLGVVLLPVRVDVLQLALLELP